MATSRMGNKTILRALDGTGERIDVHGRKLSRNIQYVQTKLLKPNPLNARFFKELTLDELGNLVENIRVNGIHTPLIARHDYTLIAGHNRLQAAQELELQHVPVQFVDEEMTEQDEIKFIISDNLLRRHLSTAEKIGLYRILFENFDERRAETVAYYEAIKNGGSDSVTPPQEPITAALISRETGQTEEAVRQQLYREQKRQKQESTKNRQTQEEVALTSAAPFTSKKVTVMLKELRTYIKDSTEDILHQISMKAEYLTQDDRKTLAQYLRTIAKQIESLQ